MTNYPTIGIRPIIDGRRFGVRESLEEKTMQMAKMAKELIESEIRYPDGTPMKCVISDCTIGGGEEAARCAQQFATQNVCATLSVTPCWCYGSETMDLDLSLIHIFPTMASFPPKPWLSTHRRKVSGSFARLIIGLPT